MSITTTSTDPAVGKTLDDDLPDGDGDLVAPLLPVLAGRRIVALTGAGCSTESGIPDYRSNGRNGPRNPIQHDAFLRREEVRRRYWARATLGWARFSNRGAQRRPPRAGVARRGRARRRRHHPERRSPAPARRQPPRRRAARRAVGRPLSALRRAEEAGRTAAAPVAGEPRLAGAGRRRPARRRFRSSRRPGGRFPRGRCASCGGDLKPDVVFFGGSVPARTLAAAWELFAAGQVLLVIGSS